MEKLADMKGVGALGELALSLGAHKAQTVAVSDILLDPRFRDMCAQNLCGRYGRCWTCPPDIGDIGTLMSEFRTYSRALVYQTVGELEDSFDFESMASAARAHNALALSLRREIEALGITDALHLAAGGCQLCEVCAKVQGAPCNHPEQALTSLEAYGVDVMSLAALAGMKYINGQNTVTYFGAVLMK